jgi:hypothetical protein
VSGVFSRYLREASAADPKVWAYITNRGYTIAAKERILTIAAFCKVTLLK